MKLKYFLTFLVISMLLFLTERSDATSIEEKARVPDDTLIRQKRAPLGKLALLGGAALLGKKAVLLGGAALGAKALVGAGIVGAGLYKAKYYGGGYGHGYGHGYSGGYKDHAVYHHYHHYEPSAHANYYPTDSGWRYNSGWEG